MVARGAHQAESRFPGARRREGGKRRSNRGPSETCDPSIKRRVHVEVIRFHKSREMLFRMCAQELAVADRRGRTPSKRQLFLRAKFFSGRSHSLWSLRMARVRVRRAMWVEDDFHARVGLPFMPRLKSARPYVNSGPNIRHPTTNTQPSNACPSRMTVVGCWMLSSVEGRACSEAALCATSQHPPPV